MRDGAGRRGLAGVAMVLLAAGAWGQAVLPSGLLQRVDEGVVAAGPGGAVEVRPAAGSAGEEMVFGRSTGVGVRWEDGQWWVLPVSETGERVEVNGRMWVLPTEAQGTEGAWSVEPKDGGTMVATVTAEGMRVRATGPVELRRWDARPHADALGKEFAVKVDGGAGMEEALAGFYWGTMLPLVVEKTMAAHFPYSSGYVLSTLDTKAYAGSYPAVDHEFQIHGRLAMGSAVDRDVVRRMIELQLRLMREDPEGLWRAPTSVQPDGRREYHIRRSSEDGKTNAAMFPVTGNIEVVGEAWDWYGATKDVGWLRAHIGDLEHAAGWTMQQVDPYGRLWGDVYFEDQVMKDGRVTQGQAFAARSFGLLGRMETVLGRRAKAAGYARVSAKMAAVLRAPLPMGYWDGAKERFVDWVDRDGAVHDHMHLLANVLPVEFGYATAEQVAGVRRLVEEQGREFERFPSFLAADVAGYTRSEIGDGGPYDLSAAGRYWYWDAAYREQQREDAVLGEQLRAVAAEGAKTGYLMGERYDMDHVFYVDGKDAHGAERYYEYPNVYAAVLLSMYVGVTVPADAEVGVTPHLRGFGEVEMGMPAYAMRYRYDGSGFALRNLAGGRRRVAVDLRGLGGGRWRGLGERTVVVLGAGEERRWVEERAR